MKTMQRPPFGPPASGGRVNTLIMAGLVIAAVLVSLIPLMAEAGPWGRGGEGGLTEAEVQAMIDAAIADSASLDNYWTKVQTSGVIGDTADALRAERDSLLGDAELMANMTIRDNDASIIVSPRAIGDGYILVWDCMRDTYLGLFAPESATVAIQMGLDSAHVFCGAGVQAKVVLNLNATGLDSLLIHSNTTVELIGTLTSKPNLVVRAGADGRFDFFISNSDSGTAKNIALYGGGDIGGTIRCTTVGCNILRFKGVTGLYVSKLRIVGPRVADGDDRGIGLEPHYCNWAILTNLTIDSCCYDGLMAWQCEHLLANNLLIRRCLANATQVDHCRYSVFSNVTADGCYNGARIAHNSDSLNVFTDFTITGINNFSSYGVQFIDGTRWCSFSNSSIKSVLTAFHFPNHPTDNPAIENYIHDVVVRDCRYVIGMGDTAGCKNRIERVHAYGVLTAFATINAGSDSNVIANNVVSGAGAGTVSNAGLNNRFENNEGYRTENTGTYYGNGEATTYYIPHGLVASPNFYTVTPASEYAGAYPFHVVSTATYLIVTFADTTASCNNEVVLRWSAEIRPRNEVVQACGAPATPLNFTATKGGSANVALEWSNVACEDSFLIQRNTAQIGAVKLNTLTYTDTTGTAGVHYGYRVLAKNNIEGPSAPSATDSGWWSAGSWTQYYDSLTASNIQDVDLRENTRTLNTGTYNPLRVYYYSGSNNGVIALIRGTDANFDTTSDTLTSLTVWLYDSTLLGTWDTLRIGVFDECTRPAANMWWVEDSCNYYNYRRANQADSATYWWPDTTHGDTSPRSDTCSAARVATWTVLYAGGVGWRSIDLTAAWHNSILWNGSVAPGFDVRLELISGTSGTGIAFYSSEAAGTARDPYFIVVRQRLE